ncbi:MAG: type I restriction-modification system endonuclease [Crocinitomicaceae bacterium]|nr:type I restriction-modification system endonuclease [Crocinitomicaceae bacterium]
MRNSNFSYIEAEYPQLAHIGQLAERNVFIDPSTTLSKLRLLLELMSKLIAQYECIDDADRMDQMTRLQKLEYAAILPPEINDLFHKVRVSGNKASHSVAGSPSEAKFMLRQTVKVVKWFYAVYENQELTFDFIEPIEQADDRSEIEALEKALASAREEVRNFKDKLAITAAIPEVQKVERKENAKKLILKIQETEAETRERIDHQLREAGWECDTAMLNFKSKKTLPDKGRSMAIAEWKCGARWADYALFIDKELVGIVEAKRHNKNVMSALQQAKNYSSDVLSENDADFVTHGNAERYKVPFIFSTNGRGYLEQIRTESGIWFWDARAQTNVERPLRNWFSPRDLKEKLIFDESHGDEKLEETPYDILSDRQGLGLRKYQIEAIKCVEHKILTERKERRALIAMATGTGKTRTMIGLCYRLIASGRFRRILFLVDRTMLGEQAAAAFNEVKIEGLQTFAQIYDLKDLDQATTDLDTKIHFATVQSMVKRIAYSDSPPSVGDYDCIVVDEAHRGYILDKEMEEEEFILRDQLDFQSKYRMVLDHFDAYRIGLTATPAIHTAEIFGEPVFNYSYRRAVIEGHLIDFEPPVVFKTKLSEEGIQWQKGDSIQIFDPEDNEIKDAGVTEDEIKVEIQGFNKQVINDSFNRTVLRELISNPDYDIDPESRKKTLIFAANNRHADMVVNILKEEYDEMGALLDADAIVKITGEVDQRKDLLRKFKNDMFPSIVVTVDLLTTGIDVPGICNLVFLRRVNSRILYDQMIGRATRKCDEIGKDVFHIYDCVGVTEIMSKEDVMKPIAPSVKKTFNNLADEIGIIEDEYVQAVKIDRVIAKLQRKLRSFNSDQMDQFKTLTNEADATEYGLKLKSLNPEQIREEFEDKQLLWDFLDREKGRSVVYGTLYSEHEDALQEVSHAYEKNLKPKDYIESFADFIKNNMNQVQALKLVCSKPASLTRRDLKELRLILDQNGYNNIRLNTAYKDITNQEIVADIIAHIRTAALGSSLVSHEERIRKAVEKLRTTHDWTSIQLKWIANIEKQLLQESIITLEDLNQPPFSNDGGLRQLDKAFKGQTKQVLDELNQYLYA